MAEIRIELLVIRATAHMSYQLLEAETAQNRHDL
jgi:hypothetical protein